MSLILVVEDEPQLQLVIEKMLKHGGHDVVLAGSGKQARQLCNEKPFDLVITDLAMPDMDGLELIRSLCHRDLPIIAISGDFSQSLKTATLLGAIATLKKPFTTAELLAMVSKNIKEQTA